MGHCEGVIVMRNKTGTFMELGVWLCTSSRFESVVLYDYSRGIDAIINGVSPTQESNSIK